MASAGKDFREIIDMTIGISNDLERIHLALS